MTRCILKSNGCPGRGKYAHIKNPQGHRLDLEDCTRTILPVQRAPSPLPGPRGEVGRGLGQVFWLVVRPTTHALPARTPRRPPPLAYREVRPHSQRRDRKAVAPFSLFTILCVLCA